MLVLHPVKKSEIDALYAGCLAVTVGISSHLPVSEVNGARRWAVYWSLMILRAVDSAVRFRNKFKKDPASIHCRLPRQSAQKG